MKTLGLLGMNHRSAPLALRERAAIATGQLPERLAQLVRALPGAELVLLSTCNRTEVYVSGLSLAPVRDTLMAILTGQADSAGLAEHFYLKEGTAAVEHLLAVTASLDALVVGETEILGQVKQAYAAAVAQGCCGRTLNRLFQGALKIAKRVHAETGIGRGRVSVSSIAVDFAERVFDELRGKVIMVLGAGEMAEATLKSLVERGVRDALILNRSLERAQALAAVHGGQAAALAALDAHLPRADIVISSTSAPDYIIRVADMERAMRVRHRRPVLLVDISVPRDVEPEVGELEDVYLYHIDDLRRVAEVNLEKRRESVAQAWQLVQAGAAELAGWQEPAGLVALLGALDANARSIREEALRRAFTKEALAGLSPAARAEIEALVDGVTGKLLAGPREQLRRAAANGHWEQDARVARALFGVGGASGADAPHADGDAAHD